MMVDKHENCNIFHYGSNKSKRIARSVMDPEIQKLVLGFDFAYVVKDLVEGNSLSHDKVRSTNRQSHSFQCRGKRQQDHGAPPPEHLFILNPTYVFVIIFLIRGLTFWREHVHQEPWVFFLQNYLRVTGLQFINRRCYCLHLMSGVLSVFLTTD